MDIADKAKVLEQRQRDDALKAQRENRVIETPDEHEGIRYCLGCGFDIDLERIEADPTAARCVPCQTLEERNR